LEDVEMPVADREEVLIRVIAPSAFIGDWHVLSGTPDASAWSPGWGGKAAGSGQDVAGSIEAVGGEVTAFHPADEVFGVGNGTFAAESA
jgi:NADPH:quinone reductase-like Zn-dependent oxidoreductase